MLEKRTQSLLADGHGALPLIRRLLLEHGRRQWRRYAIAFVLMAIGAVCTALSAYLVGDVINAAYVQRDFRLIFILSAVAFLIFAVKGIATYGHAVMLSRIANSIVAENQRRMFDRLLQQNIGFFADRHSSEFLARLTTGAAAASQVLNLLMTAIGRDLLTLVALVTVMVIQDPIMSLFAFVVAPPAMLILRKMVRRIYAIARNQFTGGTRIMETLQETLQGMRIVKAFTLEDAMRARLDANVADVEHEANKMARVANRASPLMEMLGGFAIAAAMIYAGYRVIHTGATPGEFFSFFDRLPARL